MRFLLAKVLCHLGFHSIRHTYIGGDVLSHCLDCDWTREHH